MQSEYIVRSGSFIASKMILRVLKIFLLSWLIYWSLQVVLPISVKHGDALLAFLMQLLFVAIVALSFLLVGSYPINRRENKKLLVSERIIRVTLFLSLICTALLVYDKIAIQRIDYFSGLAAAREQWRRVGEERGDHISSLASLLGYLFASCYVVTMSLLVVSPTARHGRARWIAIAGLAIINTLLTGGRSTLILVLLFYVAARIVREKSPIKIARRKRRRWLPITVMFSASSYFLFIFVQRAEATGISVAAYSQSVMSDLGLKVSGWFASDGGLSGGLFGFLNLLLAACAYFLHSFATTAAIATHGPEHGTELVVFTVFASLLSKLGLVDLPNTQWFLAGRFPSLPGILYLQGGWLLLCFSALALGAGTAVARLWYRAAPSILSLGVLLGCICILIASPILFVGDVMMFPFIMMQFFLVYIIAIFLRGARSK